MFLKTHSSISSIVIIILVYKPISCARSNVYRSSLITCHPDELWSQPSMFIFWSRQDDMSKSNNNKKKQQNHSIHSGSPMISVKVKETDKHWSTNTNNSEKAEKQTAHWYWTWQTTGLDMVPGFYCFPGSQIKRRVEGSRKGDELFQTYHDLPAVVARNYEWELYWHNVQDKSKNGCKERNLLSLFARLF